MHQVVHGTEAILFSGAKEFVQFLYRAFRKTFLSIYFAFESEWFRRFCFQGISIFSSYGHFVLQSRTISIILAEPKRA